MTKVTQNDLLAAIDALGKEQPKRPSGAGWLTMLEMARKRGMNVGAMRQRMRVALERGLKVERFVGSDYDASGALVKQTWFRAKP